MRAFNRFLRLNYALASLVLVLAISCDSNDKEVKQTAKPYADQVEKLISEMSLEEKAGQLNLIIGDAFSTGPAMETRPSDSFDDQIRRGEVGGMFNIYGAEYLHRLQKIAVEESRLGIPLLFAADVIHGFRTQFPIPLGEAASFDLDAIEEGARISARESAAAGLHMTFAPMVDISIDARWGRTAEGAGEDPFWGSLVAAARVKGFQGEDLSDPHTIAACVKHLAAYGAPEAGRDYNTVDMSEQRLRNYFLPPYQAAIEAGSASLMTAFNTLNGIPATGNQHLLVDILRKEWDFDGLVMSDYNSIGEMADHGFAKDHVEAGVKAIEAGVDWDMMTYTYLKNLPNLVKDGVVSESLLDESVRRVLALKFELGLFDDPYRYGSVDAEEKEWLSENNRSAAREMAKKSIVLLKNKKSLLPLSGSEKHIAVIGPLAKARSDMNGTWAFFGRPDDPITILEGIERRAGSQTKVSYAKGCNLYDEDPAGLAEAERLARQADLVILAIGESAVMNGEGASRADIGLPGIQQALVERVAKAGKPVVALVSSGRALALTESEPYLDAILANWTLGTESGPAIAEVLYGDYNPGAKLPITFPRSVGQVPLYYNHLHTGRPYKGDYSEPKSERVYISKYRDEKNEPLYPFGFGLSYTSFEIADLELSSYTMKNSDQITATVRVKNTGKRAGEEVVQWYIRDVVASLARPVKELKGFEKIHLEPGESKKVQFEIGQKELSFYTANGKWESEKGEFILMVGNNSRDVISKSFQLE